ncbi:MAG: aldo/keto reductase, partial [Fibrella sp.]|nr:aldo/keto reductase [Armatimonadota bacterium]
MKTISLPATDLTVSVLGFGAADMGTGISVEDALPLVAGFVEAGGNFFDTAHCYAFWERNGLGASERALGAALRRLGCADQVIVATKGGHPDGGPPYRRPDDFLAENILTGDIESSLFRLGVETIDLYYLHRDDGRTPVGEIIERLNGFIRRGWIRYIGASNWSVERIAEANTYADANGLHGFVVSQIQGSLAVAKQVPTADPTNRFMDAPTAAWHRQSLLPIVAYSATANGYFSAHPSPLGGTLYDNPDNQARRERARALATQMGCTPTQIALVYLLNQSGFPVIPLFSTKRREHLSEIIGAEAFTLSGEQVDWLSGTASQGRDQEWGLR